MPAVVGRLSSAGRSVGMTGSNPPDPTERSRWRPLRLLQAAMDADIARIYAEAQVGGLKPSFVMELLRLHARGPMTITELARVGTAHPFSAQPEGGARCVPPGWVRTTTGTDARSKKVALTAEGTRRRRPAGGRVAGHRGTASPRSRRRSPARLSQVVTEDLEQALQRKSFHDRIGRGTGQRLPGDPGSGSVMGLSRGSREPDRVSSRVSGASATMSVAEPCSGSTGRCTCRTLPTACRRRRALGLRFGGAAQVNNGRQADVVHQEGDVGGRQLLQVVGAQQPASHRLATVLRCQPAQVTDVDRHRPARSAACHPSSRRRPRGQQAAGGQLRGNSAGRCRAMRGCTGRAAFPGAILITP